MRLLSMLLAFAFVAGCEVDDGVLVAPAGAPSAHITSYADLDSHPESVRVVAKQLGGVRPDTTVAAYEKILENTDLVDVPYQHFKDYEHYWSVRTSPDDPRSYIVAGAFADDRLVYSTINVIEQVGGKWRTIWSIQHDEESAITPRIRRSGSG